MIKSELVIRNKTQAALIEKQTGTMSELAEINCELKKNVKVLEDSVKRTRTINQILTDKVDEEQALVRGMGLDKVAMAQELHKKDTEIKTLIKTIFIIKENTINNL